MTLGLGVIQSRILIGKRGAICKSNNEDLRKVSIGGKSEIANNPNKIAATAAIDFQPLIVFLLFLAIFLIIPGLTPKSKKIKFQISNIKQISNSKFQMFFCFALFEI